MPVLSNFDAPPAPGPAQCADYRFIAFQLDISIKNGGSSPFLGPFSRDSPVLGF